MITLEGERELYAKIEQTTEASLKAARRGLQEGGLKIIADAKENLRGNHSVVSGQLRASGKVQAVEGDEDAIDAGFFAQGGSQGYAYFVEYGRRATKTTQKGNPTLKETLEAWLHKKFGIPYGKELKQRAFLLARKIHRKGTKPHPFFGPAVEKNRAEIEKAIGKAVKEEI
jgi:hypothetical protein